MLQLTLSVVCREGRGWVVPSLASGFASVSCLPPPTNLIPQCDDIVSSLSPSLVTLGELKPPQQHNLTTFLRLAGCSVQGECPGSEDVVNNQKLFSTAYCLVSALAGMDQKKKGKKCCCLEIALFTVWDIWYIRFPPS